MVDFYREEFLRHLCFLAASGSLGDTRSEYLVVLYRRFIDDLDRLCACARFPVVAETLLKRFDTLTGLSRCAPRRVH